MKQFEHYLNKVRNRVNEVVGDTLNIDITIKDSDERDPNYDKNKYPVYDVAYQNDVDGKLIDIWGDLKPYHDGRATRYEFETSWFPDKESEEYYDENSEEIEKQILIKFQSMGFNEGMTRKKTNESVEAPAKLRSVTVEYSDGTKINTSMAAHLSDDEIKDYFQIGRKFNLGNAPIDGDGDYGDNIQTVKDVVINEATMNKDDLFNILKKYTSYLYDNGHVGGDVIKNGIKIINKFMGVGESVVNEHYNIMVVTVPPVAEWYEVQLSPIVGDTCMGFDFMGKKYCIRGKDMDMFKASVGKNVKFKYDKDAGNSFMDSATVTESAMNESQSYHCDNCGERAEHEEIEENPNMKCSNCGASDWV